MSDTENREVAWSSEDNGFIPADRVADDEMPPWELEDEENTEEEANNESEGHWFKDSWFGRLLGLDQESVAATETSNQDATTETSNQDAGLKLVLCADGTYATGREVDGVENVTTPDQRYVEPDQYVDVKNGERGGYVVLEDGSQVDYHWFVNEDTGCLEQRLADGSKINGAVKYVDEIFGKERTDAGIGEVPEKSFWRNSMVGRWLGLDDESTAKRQVSGEQIRASGQIGGGSWFANSWFGRLIGIDDETRLAKMSNDSLETSNQLREKGEIPGGYIANSWIGRAFGRDDETRLASYQMPDDTIVEEPGEFEEREPNASRYIGLHADELPSSETAMVYNPKDNQYTV